MQLVSSHLEAFCRYLALYPLVNATKRESTHVPYIFFKALGVFIVAIYLIQSLNANDKNKLFDYRKQQLYLSDNKSHAIERTIPFQDIQAIEELKYSDGDYTHYELNIQLRDGERIHLFSDKSDTFIKMYAEQLNKKLQKPIEKIRTAQH